MSEIKENKCPNCNSHVEKPLIKKEYCEGPENCVQSEWGKHVHTDSLCPFCGYVFLSYVERGEKI